MGVGGMFSAVNKGTLLGKGKRGPNLASKAGCSERAEKVKASRGCILRCSRPECQPQGFRSRSAGGEGHGGFSILTLFGLANVQSLSERLMRVFALWI